MYIQNASLPIPTVLIFLPSPTSSQESITLQPTPLSFSFNVELRPNLIINAVKYLGDDVIICGDLFLQSLDLAVGCFLLAG